MKTNSKHAFTLIELLIVVAIIAILAAIAVPNFLEAQVRSKVGRAKADMRATATALEAYRVDNSKYPVDQAAMLLIQWPTLCLHVLTTPVAYMTSVPQDTFIDKHQSPTAHPEVPDFQRWYRYHAQGLIDATPQYKPIAEWSLASAGPDNTTSRGEYYMFGFDALVATPALPALPNVPPSTVGALYDPTNGTVSIGDIVRLGP